MIRYVLNSGGFHDKPEHAQQFIAEVLAGHGDRPRVLISIFAETRETWAQRYEKTINRFAGFLPDGIEPEYEMASDDYFQSQVDNCDVVFFYGGDVEVLAARLQQYDIPAIFTNKTVAGTSAGAAVWGKYYWEPYTPAIRPGLGIIPMKFIPHYGAGDGIDWEQVLISLQGYADIETKTYALPEGEFVVIEG